MNSLVTVVIPAYNASEYIGETIESVLQQSFTDFELLVINDGSTDNTAEVVRSYSQKDSRVTLLSQVNQGVSVARNTGIQQAKGEFVAFLDSDDLWLPNKLDLHVQHLSANPQLGMSFGRVEFISFDGKPTGQLSNPHISNITPKDLYEENPAITPSNAVIRRDVLEQIGGFDRDLSGYADAELFLRVSCYGWQVEGIDRVLVYYRTSVSGMSSQLDSMEEDWNCFTKKIQAYAPDLVKEHYNRARGMLLRYLARRALRLGLASKVGVSFMNRALRSDWMLMFREPRRTLLTMLAVYGKHITSGFSANNP